MNASNTVVATRTLFDGARVTITSDGKIADPLHQWFGRIHSSRLWEVINNLCTYTAAEVRSMIKAGGEWNRRVKPAARVRRHSAWCPCAMCGGQKLSRGWIAGAPIYTR